MGASPNRIQAVLDREIGRHPELADFFDTGRPERFFVKNLERVQGDERDVIILSVGYGKDRAGNLPLRFGPILSAGGRRRLNVAATRAKQRVILVSSFRYSDINSTQVKPGTGLEFLKNYIEYASSGGILLTRSELTNEPMNDFEVDVFDALSARGIEMVPQVGCSKFRIDLAAEAGIVWENAKGQQFSFDEATRSRFRPTEPGEPKVIRTFEGVVKFTKQNFVVIQPVSGGATVLSPTTIADGKLIRKGMNVRFELSFSARNVIADRLQILS